MGDSVYVVGNKAVANNGGVSPKKQAQRGKSKNRNERAVPSEYARSDYREAGGTDFARFAHDDDFG